MCEIFISLRILLIEQLLLQVELWMAARICRSQANSTASELGGVVAVGGSVRDHRFPEAFERILIMCSTSLSKRLTCKAQKCKKKRSSVVRTITQNYYLAGT
jgi:hypothetical protein